MKKWIKMVLLVLAVTMLLSGCFMRTVEELYCLPKRSQADNELQSVIDKAMSGLSYCSPIYGQNRQMVQQADLDGDGDNEYIVLARDSSQQPLKILIFNQNTMGYRLTEIIEGYGFAYDFVEFTNIDDVSGVEILVGRQVGDGVVRSAAVYTYRKGAAVHMLEVSYSKIITCDLDGDTRSELVLLHPGDSAELSSKAALYRYEDGEIRMCSQMETSKPSGNIQRMEPVILQDGSLAVLVSATEKNIQSMEVFTFADNALSQIYGPAYVDKLKNYFVYPTDVDGDGDTDFPELVPVQGADGNTTSEHWVLWYGINRDGDRADGMYTFHNYSDKWYLHMDQNWINRLTVNRTDGVCTFLDMDGRMVMTVYSLTGPNSLEQVYQLGGTVLGRSETVLFAATLGPGAESLGITARRLEMLFYPIEMKLDMEEGGSNYE